VVSRLYDFGFVLFLAVAVGITLGAYLAESNKKNEDLKQELEDCRERANHANVLEGNYA